LHQKAAGLAVGVKEAKDWVIFGVYQWLVHLILSEVHEVEDFDEDVSIVFD